QKENFARTFLPYLTRQIGRPKAPIYTRNIYICLFEDGVFLTCQRQVAYHMQAMPSTYCPAGHYRNHHLIHKTYLSLHIEDIKPVDTITPCVTWVGARPLITTRTESPSAIFMRRPCSTEQHHSEGLGFVCYNQCIQEFRNRFR